MKNTDQHRKAIGGQNDPEKQILRMENFQGLLVEKVILTGRKNRRY